MTIRRPVAVMLLAGVIPALAMAQPYDPDAPVPDLQSGSVPMTAPPQTTLGETGWKDANDAVGTFRRGHIDILKWEADNPASASRAVTQDGNPLSASAAVRMAVAARPELFATSDMNEQERAQADIAFVELAGDVHRAWIKAVAAEQRLRHARDVFAATEAGTELAIRMTRGGNWGQDRLMAEQRALSAAGTGLARAQRTAVGAREALIRLLGLWGEDAQRMRLPDSLPDLPQTAMTADGLEAAALRRHPRLPLEAVEAERAHRATGSRAIRIWNEVTEEALGRAQAGSPDDANAITALPSSAPFVDLRRSPVSHEEVRAIRAQAEARALAVKIRSQVREAWHQYHTAYNVALAATEEARLAEAQQEDTLLRYNGMLKSTWDLLASARERVASADSALAAQRDFWIAHTDLQAVLAGAEYRGPDADEDSASRTGGTRGH